MLAAASFFSSGCTPVDERTTQPQGVSLKDQDIANYSLPAIVVTNVRHLENGIYEIPASQLKDWTLKFTKENPNRVILWVEPSAQAKIVFGKTHEHLTSSVHTTGFLAYTVDKSTFSGIPTSLEK